LRPVPAILISASDLAAILILISASDLAFLLAAILILPVPAI